VYSRRKWRICSFSFPLPPGEFGEVSEFHARPPEAISRRKKKKMKTENAETALEEITHERAIRDLISSYAQDESNDHFYPLLERLLKAEQIPTAIELLKLRALNKIHGDLDTIAVKGIGTHIAKLAIAIDHMDDYGIQKRVDE
jgi:hypothetical protein